MGPVLKIELEEPNKLVPEGATICLKHYLTGPNTQETRDALEKEEDVHSIIKIVKAGEHFNIDGRFGQIKHVVKECFETNYLQNHKLCYLRASAFMALIGGKPICEFTITKHKERCPNAENSLCLYSHCRSIKFKDEEILGKNTCSI